MLQTYNNQNSVVLAQKQTYGSKEQPREPRNNPHTDSQLVFNKGDKTIYTMEKRQSVQQVVFGKPGS